MNTFQAFRASRKSLPATGAKRAGLAVGNIPEYTSPGYDGAYTRAMDGFLAQRRSRTPTLINYDKISMVQNMAGAVYLPIAFAATQLARAKPVVYQHTNNPKDPDGRRRLPAYDPVYNIFRRPNPNDTLRTVLYSMSMQYDLTGECYVWMPPLDSRTGELSDHGEPLEMYVIPSAWVSGLPSCPWWEGGVYQVTPYVSQYPGGTQSAYIPAEQMVRMYDPHPLYDKTAYSVLQAISQSIDTVRAIDQSRASAQAQGCQQDFVVELDAQLQNPGVADMKRIRENFEKIYAGASNSGKALFLPPGAKASKISTTPDDMAWQEGWSQITDFVIACFQTNRAAVGMSGDLNFATLYASIKQVYWSKFEPRLEYFGQAFTKDYFDPYVGEDYFAEFELPRMDDETQKLAGLKLDLEAGVLTKGQYLRERGYEVDPETTPGLDELIGGKPATPAQPQQEPKQDPAVEAARPRPSDGIDPEKLFAVLDREKVRGTIRNGNGRH